MMQDVHVKLIENCQGVNGIQQEETIFYQQIGIKFNKKLLDFYIWSRALYGATHFV